MATIPHYHNGTWTEAPAEEGQEGWQEVASIGEEVSLHVIAYVSPSGRFWLKIFQESGTEHDELISAGSLHDVSDLLGRWAPAMLSNQVTDSIEPLLTQIINGTRAR